MTIDLGKMKNDLHRTCTYCGSEKSLTNDHVPPKNIFPEPRPSDLVTVPACEQCNRAASADEEYFRIKLCLSEQVSDSTDARKNRDAILRSLNRPQAIGLRHAFFSDINLIHLRTPAGLYLAEKRLAFDVDLSRIFRVVEKTVRGLFFHETKIRLASTHEVDVHSNETLSQYSPDILEEWTQKILLPLAQKPPKIIGNGAFAYRVHITEEDPFLSVWALTFYERIPFLCLTGPIRIGSNEFGV